MARRARIILRLADGGSYFDIERGLGESSRTIGKWKRRFLTDRVAGLHGRYPGAIATVLTPALEAHSRVAEAPDRWVDALEQPATGAGPEVE